MIRVLIADDQALLRGSFRLLIDLTPDCITVAEAGTGAEAVAATTRHRPDIVLMDVRMPDLDGIEATRRICADPANAATKVLILTTFDLDEYVFGALRAGASGFLLKDTPPGDLLTAVRVVAGGDALLAPSVTRRLIGEFARRPGPAHPGPAHPGPAHLGGARPVSGRLDTITGREREVLLLVARGLSNTEIAADLHISLPTAKTHVGRLLTKLDARDRAQLVVIAYETGLVRAGRG